MIEATRNVVAIGECMLELSGEASSLRLGCGGDSFNTAVYLRRSNVAVRYLTAIGDDPFSDCIRTAFYGEGIDQSLVLTAPGRLPGLYAIRTDAYGERTFFYWREQAAVRELFGLEGCEQALDAATRADLLYVTGITLSLFGQADRQRLVELARRTRERGGAVAFDPNYRARGWSDAEAAKSAMRSILPFVSMGLPTHEDERLLYGDRDPQATMTRWRNAGVEEIVVKTGAEGCLVEWEGDSVAVAAEAAVPIDTTGAGDSFNAGYIAGRLHGAQPPDAARSGHRLAAEVIRHRGAIIPSEAMPPQRLTAFAG